jgi:hypothetical protein
MKSVSVSATRIMLRDRGSVSDLSVQGELVIALDDPDEDAMIQGISENLRVSTLSSEVQAAIQLIYDAVQVRLEKKFGVVSG